jgi:hypothetical protein
VTTFFACHKVSESNPKQASSTTMSNLRSQPAAAGRLAHQQVRASSNWDSFLLHEQRRTWSFNHPVQIPHTMAK